MVSRYLWGILGLQSLEGWNISTRLLKISETIQTTERNIMSKSKKSTTSFDDKVNILVEISEMTTDIPTLIKIKRTFDVGIPLARSFSVGLIPMTETLRRKLEVEFEGVLAEIFYDANQDDQWDTGFVCVQDILDRHAEVLADWA